MCVSSRISHIISKYPLLALFLLATLIFSSGLGLRDPWPADEPRFALSAKQMVESGDWMFPHRGNELYAEKPPLFIWTIALFYQLTGNMRIAFLLPSLLASLATLWLSIDLTSRLWNRHTGILAGIILLTTFQFTLQAKTAQIDALLTLWTTLGVYGLTRHLLLGPQWKWYFAAFAAMGLGVITKGVGILPIFILLPYLLARYWCWPNVTVINGRWWQWALGPLMMLAVIAAWLLPMLALVSSSADPSLAAYRDNLLWHQTVDRYANSWHHQQPTWYLPEQSLGLWLPVTLFLPWLLPAWWRKLRNQDAYYLLLLGWIVLVIIFFSIPAGKRGVYLLPATPALALITAPILVESWQNKGVRRTALMGTLFLASTLLGTALFYGVLVTQLGEELLKNYPIDPWPLLAVTGIIGLLISTFTRRKNPLVGLMAFFCCAWLLYGWWGYALLNPIRSAAPFMETVHDRLGPKAEIGLVDWKEQLVLEAKQPVKTFGFSLPSLQQARLAIQWAEMSDNRWLLVSEDAMQPCFIVSKSIDMGLRHRKHWYLLNSEAVIPICKQKKIS